MNANVCRVTVSGQIGANQMNEFYVALVVFFGTVVAFFTATIGYLKVWKPLKGNGDSEAEASRLNLTQLLNATEIRMSKQDTRITNLTSKVKMLATEVQECEMNRLGLLDENRQLRQRLDDIETSQ